MDWQITIGEFQLALLARCEIHKSVDLLSDTCVIELPASSYNVAIRVEEQLKRGDKVMVKIGYDNALETEFEGYLLNLSTDDGKIAINCEDELFLFRKAVADKQFAKQSVKEIAQYLIAETGIDVGLNVTLTMDYEKFVISKATGFDVLKKIQEETKANIYMQDGLLQIHPPYIEKAGEVAYSFQQNVEACNLKYIRKEDKKIEIVVNNTSKNGKKNEKRYGTTGGDQITISGNGLSEASMEALAKQEYNKRWFDGYEGDLATWLIPIVRPAFTASLTDEDYEYKNGNYYVSAVTTTLDENGGVRKVQLGVKVG